MRTSGALKVAIAVLVLGSAAVVESQSTVDLEAARASLMDTDEAWYEEYASSDTPADVFADNMTEEAHLLPPGAPMANGREAIRSVIAELEAIPGFSVTWGPIAADVADGGDLGYTIGTYEMKMAPEGTPIVISGKYLTVWKKQSDGTWKVVADMFNADGPPSADEG